MYTKLLKLRKLTFKVQVKVVFSVDSNDLKFTSFKFGNDIFITFEMPRYYYYQRPIGKINMSLLSDVLGLIHDV